MMHDHTTTRFHSFSTRAAALLALVAGLTACGASTSLDDEPPERPCFGASADLSLTPNRSPAGATTHWVLRGWCIASSYDPALAGSLREITAALGAWRSTCSDLCFEAPVSASVTPAIGERRIHFTTTPPPSLPVDASTGTVMSFENSTGRILSAQVFVRPEATARMTARFLMVGVGRALGFASAAAGADSMLAPDSDRSAPSASDLTSVCALYGRTPWCERP